MNDCATLNTHLIPLSKVVAASIVDTYSDIGNTELRFNFWAVREARKILRQSFNSGKQYATLIVNKNTNTATLPLDVRNLLFVGYIYNGQKIPIILKTTLVNDKAVKDIPCDDACPRCNQSKSICNDLTVTESTEIVTVNGSNYTLTTIKKLYNNGNYYLEKNIPYFNTVTSTVEFTTTKEFITTLDLLPCGCLATTPENLAKVETFCPDVFGCYYASCAPCDTSMGGYRVFEETGLIQLESRFKSDKLYIEYSGFMPKLNGQLAVPEVAFEVIVEGVKLRAIKNKNNVSLRNIQWQTLEYNKVRSAMDKELGAISLDRILQAITLTPKFDISWERRYDFCGVSPVATQVDAPVDCETSSTITNTNNNDNMPFTYLAPFALSVIVDNGGGSPVSNTFSWTSLQLVNALNVETIVVNNNIESKAKGEFTFDSATGTIVRVNPFQPADVIIFSFAKYI